jgi:protein-glucosylgalactosylhydroxylysine glucosidase
MRKLYLFFLVSCTFTAAAQPIDRKSVVDRHKVVLTVPDTLGSLSVGNGRFAFTFDVTGFQSYPEAYTKGVPLGTQSDWGWHRYPDTLKMPREQALVSYPLDGRQVGYLVQPKAPEAARKAADFYRINPHRLQLGIVGLEIRKKDGTVAAMQDLTDIRQVLDPWTGIITSRFKVEGDLIETSTTCDPQLDMLGFRVKSALLRQGRLKVLLRFPYPNGQFKDVGDYFGSVDRHQTKLDHRGNVAQITHTLDTTVYRVQVAASAALKARDDGAHRFIVEPAIPADEWSFRVAFSTPGMSHAMLLNTNPFERSRTAWKGFWMRGGAIDFAGSTDPRAFELERRMILSRYLTKIQCVSENPPQETGLTYNSWFGKPHIEMHWWHAVHFAQWGHPELMEQSMDWYVRSAGKAREIAQRQGYRGLRWQKMTDNEGDETPSSVGAFLIWQQPHLIFMAEMLHQRNPSAEFRNKYKQLVYGTAEFMADFARFDPVKGRYDLGKGLIPAQECFDPVTTFNPNYELAYWSWALQTAQRWRIREGLPPNTEWADVIKRLAPLPVKDGVYLASESTPDCYVTPRYMTDHPAVLGAYGMLPAVHGLDTAVMGRTLDLVKRVWDWDETWGWDYPMMAMTAARLGRGEDAVSALLMQVRTNTYLKNGHNYQDGRLTIYLPGNGGLLSALALMCTGGEGQKGSLPGFPKDGRWKVRYEGLSGMF